MIGCVWHEEGGAYRLRPVDWPRGSAVVSLLRGVGGWRRIVWSGPMWPDYGETVGTLEDAQREAVAHARRVGAMSERDEVEG